MEWVAVLNKIMSLKVVQYALLALTIAAMGTCIYLYITLTAVRLLKSRAETANNTLISELANQNTQVNIWKAEGDAAEKRTEQAQKDADRLRLDMRLKDAAWSKAPIPVDCEGAINYARQWLKGEH